MGLLDFIKTPEGQGLLSAAFTGMATANKGTPWNNLGKAGVGGIMGYSNALTRQDQMAENAIQNQVRQMQMGEIARKQEEARKRAEFIASLPPDQQQALQMGVSPDKLFERANPDPNRMSRKDELDYMSQLRKDEREFAAKLAAGNKPAAQPYFQFIATPNGIVKADARSGNMAYGDINGSPVVKSADSPELQGKIAEAEKLGAETGKQKSLMQGKEDALTSVKEASKMLNQGIYSGAYANLKMKGAKYIPGVSTDTAARTEEFMAYIGNTVVPRLQEFGGNDSNEELRYLRGIMGGEITMEEKALKKILADSERKIQAGINRLKMQPKGKQDNNDPLGLR